MSIMRNYLLNEAKADDGPGSFFCRICWWGPPDSSLAAILSRLYPDESFIYESHSEDPGGAYYLERWEDGVREDIEVDDPWGLLCEEDEEPELPDNYPKTEFFTDNYSEIINKGDEVQGRALSPEKNKSEDSKNS